MPDSLISTLPSDNNTVIDLRGNTLTQADLEAGISALARNKESFFIPWVPRLNNKN